jgi:hypothetical protein
MCRKNLPLVLAVLALLVSSVAFAADQPAAPMSQEEFFTSLQAQPGDAGEELPDLDGTPDPVLKHGSCSYIGVKCRRCTLPNGTSGQYACDADQCIYNGSSHVHYYNCGGCGTTCSI